MAAGIRHPNPKENQMSKCPYDENAKTKCERRDSQTVHHDFDACDAKGRALGTRVCTYVGVYTDAPTGANWYFRVPVGTYFTFSPHATRNGQPYGAWQPDQVFTTEAERDAALTAYLAGARKRALKVAKAAAHSPVARPWSEYATCSTCRALPGIPCFQVGAGHVHDIRALQAQPAVPAGGAS